MSPTCDAKGTFQQEMFFTDYEMKTETVRRNRTHRWIGWVNFPAKTHWKKCAVHGVQIFPAKTLAIASHWKKCAVYALLAFTEEWVMHWNTK